MSRSRRFDQYDDPPITPRQLAAAAASARTPRKVSTAPAVTARVRKQQKLRAIRASHEQLNEE